MRILQINAVYERFSTGRTTKEMHEYFLAHDIESFVAAPELNGLTQNSFKIGNKLDHKIHALESRLWGLQGYFSYFSTRNLLTYVEKIEPNVVILRNLHGNYINLPLLLRYLAENQIATVLVLHDSWFYTGKCVYYIEDSCEKWKDNCGKCPALKKGNSSFFFDRSAKMLRDKKKLFSGISKLAVIGVSKWVADDARQSIVGNAKVVDYIYNWIDLQQFRPGRNSGLKKKLNLDHKFIILGIAMIWVEQKGIDIFCKLSSMLPEEFQIVLVGAYDAKYAQNSKIKFIGSVKDADRLADLYDSADVFMNPSIQETFGKTTAEALSCGTPVIAYNSTATPELIGKTEDCGFLIDSLEASDYLEAIMKIYEAGKEHYMGKCRKRAENLFDKEKNIKRYLEVFQTINEEK